MSSIPLHSLGANEQVTAPIFTKIVNAIDPFGLSPLTEFDLTAEAMFEWIRQELSYDFVNWKAWYLIPTSWPIKNFLTNYINISNQWGVEYTGASYNTWYDYFTKKLDYSDTKADYYLRALGAVIAQGDAGDSITNPDDYDPPKPNTWQGLVWKIALLGVGGIAAYKLTERGIFGK